MYSTHDLRPANGEPEEVLLGDEEWEDDEGEDGPEVAQAGAVAAYSAGAAPGRDRGQERIVERVRRLVSKVRRHEEGYPYEHAPREAQASRQQHREHGERHEVRHPLLPQVGDSPKDRGGEDYENRGDSHGAVDQSRPSPEIAGKPDREEVGQDADREDRVREIVEHPRPHREPGSLAGRPALQPTLPGLGASLLALFTHGGGSIE
ncbi:MAG: hypothetical protein LC781_17570 [Actinobacteria bacterium]|nr:hypothetical protein [Actinomycetota bacterium]